MRYLFYNILNEAEYKGWRIRPILIFAVITILLALYCLAV